jgi:serine protease
VTARGALVVVAAGNSQGFADSMQLKRPADCRGVLAVGSVHETGLKTDYSYVGANMGLMAPGGDRNGFGSPILSTDNAGTQGPAADVYGYKAGTSFSSPLAAGVASLMLALNPSLTPAALIARMKASARPHAVVAGLPSCASNNQVACNCTTATCGAGLLDAYAAVQAAYAPAAVIAGVGAPSAGSVISLDGRASTAVAPASISSYSWSVVQGATASASPAQASLSASAGQGGINPSATLGRLGLSAAKSISLGLSNTSAAVAQLQLPSSAGTFVFKLTVLDSLGRSGESLLSVTSVAPVASNSGGGGADSLWFAAALGWLMLISLFFSRKR